MAWFGDTFGDGLSSLKGQITKITEKVLLDDPLAATSFEGRIKELEEECTRYSKQVESLQVENKRLKEGRSFEISDDQILNMCQLENQLAEVTAEKNALIKTLDEMDVDHQKELDVLIKDRDSLRDKLKGNLINNHTANDDVDQKTEELAAAVQQLQLQNDILFEEGKSKDQELLHRHDEAERLLKMVATLERKIYQQVAERDELKANAEKLENDLHTFNSERSNLHNKVQDLTRVIQETEKNLSAVKTEKESLNVLVERLKHQLLEKDNMLKELQADVASTEQFTQLENKIQTLSQENERLEAELHSFRTNNFENDNTASLINENKKLLENLSVCESLLASYKSKEAAVIENSKAFDKLQGENLYLQEKCSSLETTMTNLQEEVVATAEKLTLENVELKNKLLASNELENKLQEADNVIQNLMIEIQKTEEIKISFESLITENSELQNRVKVLEQDASKSEELEQRNTELKKQLENIMAENSSKLAVLTADNSDLEQQLRAITDENATILESLTTENSNLKHQIKESVTVTEDITKENVQLKLKLQETADLVEELMKENSELKIKLQQLEVDGPDGLATENQELKEKLQKLEALVAQTEERENLMSGTLGLEILKLKGIVGRIRREFLRSTDQRDEPTAEAGADDRSGKDVMIQSQTDDIKRLQQDVSQMTEIIKMIDQGLTTIYQDKSTVEKELAVLQSVAARTEQELTATVKTKQQLEANIREWSLAVSSRDEAIQTLMVEKNSLENSIKVLEAEKTNLLAINSAQADEIKKIETDRGIIQEKLQQVEHSSEEWKPRLDQLQTLYKNEAKRSEDLCRKKDEQIAEFTRNSQANSIEKQELQVETVESVIESVEASDVNSEKTPEIRNLQDQVARLLDENSDLKMLVQQLRENIFMMNTRVPDGSSKQNQHRRSHSEVEDHKTELQTEQARYHALLAEHRNLTEKEENLRREVDRLRAHMVEVEEHYTEEAMTAEAQLSELRDKLAIAEEQLRSSSTVYKSANVRSTQHLEALQTQIHLMGVQRTDLQRKLSDAEDHAQKQAAALASLQLVLEQFQLDKQRELQALGEKHKYQSELERRRTQELEHEIENLKQQLMEAKNGLKAALRLGEQLEKKSQLISELEEDLKKTRGDLSTAESKLSTYSQSTAGKIDRSLVKNLVVGYLGAQGDHKAQALKILSSVLELSPKERSRVGVEGQGGWLSHLLHPSSSSAPPTESLSQAFVRFLESESRPQPQLKLLTEPQTSQSTSRRTPLLLSDLVLPPVTPTQVTEAGLSDVLRDS